METIRHDAHLLKENVEVVGVQQSKLRVGGGDTVATPKRAFAIHSDATKTTGTSKKGLHDSTAKKRRVLGDISNRHRNRHAAGDDGAGDTVTQPTKALKSVRKSDVRVKKALSARIAKSVPLVKPTPALGAKPAQSHALQALPTQPDEVEEIEHAYGGLPSTTPDASYLASLRDEMLNDIVNSKTQSLIDDYDETETFDAWKDADEHTLLAASAAPSAWWSQPTSALTDESAKSDPLWSDDGSSAAPLLDDVPAPDDFADPAYDEHDDVLDELLNVDVDATCT